jgi:hypothetical protein
MPTAGCFSTTGSAAAFVTTGLHRPELRREGDPELPEVTDVFVYGVPAASGAPGGKDVVAAIVAASGVSFDPGAIYAACRRCLDRTSCRVTYRSSTRSEDRVGEAAERFLLERFDPSARNVYRPSRLKTLERQLSQSSTLTSDSL